MLLPNDNHPGVNPQQLLEYNKKWAQTLSTQDPEFFKKLAAQQSPEYLWIGCSDSRVPANEIVGLMPGELFVHRNIANIVVHTDLNCLSVLQFAIDVLKVKHVIVCGHYGCSGVLAALSQQRVGLSDIWLRHVQDVSQKYHACLSEDFSPVERLKRLCELNVIEQVRNVCQNNVVQDAWSRNQALTIHGWIYGLKDGLLRDLGVCASHKDELEEKMAAAVKKITALS